MIKFTSLNYFQNMRYIKDVIEPLAVSIIKRQNHTFFVHRCSDYIDIHHLAKCHSYELSNVNVELFEKYWTAMDVVQFVVEGTPPYSKTKEYFDKLRDMLLKTKVVEDFQLYEVKLANVSSKPTISYKTFCLQRELKEDNRTLKIFKVMTKGFLGVETEETDLNNIHYVIKTHYGRGGYYVDLGSK